VLLKGSDEGLDVLALFGEFLGLPGVVGVLAPSHIQNALLSIGRQSGEGRLVGIAPTRVRLQARWCGGDLWRGALRRLCRLFRSGLWRIGLSGLRLGGLRLGRKLSVLISGTVGGYRGQLVGDSLLPASRSA
jgi:hypothetical protein